MAWYHRLLNVVRPDHVSDDLEREIASHLAERTDDLVAAGMNERDAAESARRRFGNRTIHKARARDADGMVWLESLLADFRYAVRALRASPGFTLVAVLSLALGIGANTAIFSLTNAVALKSLPVSHPEELVVVSGDLAPVLTNPIWEEISKQQQLFASSFAYSSQQFNLNRGGVVRRAQGSWISGGYFNALGVRPIAGRLLQPGDDVRGCRAAAVVSNAFAQREFGEPSAAVGKTLTLDGQPFQIVGVAAPGFFGMEVGRAEEVYAPLCAEVLTTGDPKILGARSHWYLRVIGRPRPGMTLTQLRAGLRSASSAIFSATVPLSGGAANQRSYLEQTLTAKPAATGESELRDTYQQALLIIMLVVGVVLLIACANIANLLLARAAARQREVAIRLALGASRWRLVRQLLTESLLLSLSGAVLGIVFARWASRLLVAFLGGNGRGVWLDLSLDGRVLGFTIAVAIITGILFGLAPAWRSAHVDPQAAMKSGGRGVVAGGMRHRLGRALVVGQVALSLALVSAAGLLMGSFHRLTTLDPGFRRDGVLLVQMDFSPLGLKGHRLVTEPAEVLRRIRALPGVISASMAMLTPIGGMGWNDFVIASGFRPTSRHDSLAYFNHVSDGYFETMGTTLTAGRDLNPDDVAQARSVALVNETMARGLFGPGSPIGRTFRTPVGDSMSPQREVIGVVQDAKYQRLDEKPLATAYFPYGVGEPAGARVSFQMRVLSAAPVVSGVKGIAASLSPDISLEFTTLSAQVSESLARPRVLAVLSGFFGALALLLAVIGLYGTMAYSVTQRRNEIGIRMALGAGNWRMLRMVVSEAGILVAAGIVGGTALALASTRVLASFLYGVTPTDPATLGISVVVLATIAMAATAAPAWRAARLDPMTALRED